MNNNMLLSSPEPWVQYMSLPSLYSGQLTRRPRSKPTFLFVSTNRRRKSFLAPFVHKLSAPVFSYKPILLQIHKKE